MKASDKLRAYWSKQENDLMLYHPLGSQTVCDAHWLSIIIGDREFLDELSRRGYDVKTMRFSVEPKKANPRFASQRKSEQTKGEV